MKSKFYLSNSMNFGKTENINILINKYWQKLIFITGFARPLLKSKIVVILFSLIFISNRAVADYTIPVGTTVDASYLVVPNLTLLQLSGTLTINGTLNVSTNTSLLNYTSIIINAPSGNINWTANVDLHFSAGISFDINNPNKLATVGLLPTSGSAAIRLYIGNIIIAVSNSNSNNAAYSFAQFNAAGGIPKFYITNSILSPSGICSGSTFVTTLTPYDNVIAFDCVWTVSQGSITPLTATNFNSAITSTITPTTIGTYIINCTIYRNGDVDPIVTKADTIIINAIYAIPGIPTSPTASPASICTGGGSNLSATSLSNSINWYNTSTGGTSLGNSLTNVNFPVNPTSSTSYYAEALTPNGCVSAARTAPFRVTVSPLSIGGTIPSITQACSAGSTGSLTLSGYVGLVNQWEYSTNLGSSWTVIANTATTQAYTVATTSKMYRALVQSGTCAATYSSTNTVGIHNMWSGVLSSDWLTATNWGDGLIPSIGCPIVEIPSVTPNKPVLTGTATINGLLIDANTSLTLSGGTLQIAGGITNNGIFTVNSGTLEFNGTTAQTLAGSMFANNTINNLTITNSAGLTATGTSNPLNITGTLAFGNKSNCTFNTGNNVVLISTATATASVADITNNSVNSGNTIIGTVSVERYFPSHRNWLLLTSPLSGTNTIFSAWQTGAPTTYIAGRGMFITGPAPTGSAGNGLDYSSLNNYSLKTFNSTTGLYVNVGNTMQSLSGAGSSAANIGYFTFVRGDRNRVKDNTNIANFNATTLSSVGTLQTGTQTFNIAGGSYALIGNPYASSIDFTKVSFTNAYPSRFIVWDPSIGTMGAFVNMDDISNPGTFSPSISGSVQGNFIQSSQAFFAQITAPSASIVFKETSKSTNYNSGLFRPIIPATKTKALWVSLLQKIDDKHTLLVDGGVVYFDNKFDDTVNIEDALKFTNITENLGILRDNSTLCVERRSLPKANDTIFLKLTRTTIRNYRFQFVPAEFDTTLMAILEDNFTNKSTPLSLRFASTIDFKITSDPKSKVSDRFKIILIQAAAAPVAMFDSEIKACKQKTNILVNWPNQKLTNLNRFELEKSTNGVDFIKIYVTAPMRTDQNNDYSYLDTSAVIGANLYRVRSVTNLGDFRYSPTVVVNMTKAAATGITVYPNPVMHSTIGLKFTNMPEGAYTISLTNNLGQTILSKYLFYTAGTSLEELKPDGNLMKGIYYLQVILPSKEITKISVLVN